MATTLTAEQLNTLTIDATLGREKPSVPGEEAAKIFEELKKQVASIEKSGMMVDFLPD